MRLDTILEWQRPEQILAYHGTASTLIPSILGNGLQPYPKKRSWEGDPAADVHASSRASVGGIYLTTDLGVATSSALRSAQRVFGGNQAVVVAKVVLRSAIADEDDFTFIINDSLMRCFGPSYIFTPERATEVWAASLRDDPRARAYVQRVIDGAIDNFWRYFAAKYETVPHDEMVRRVMGILNDLFMAEITRRASQSFRRDADYDAESETKTAVYNHRRLASRAIGWENEWENIPLPPEAGACERRVLELKDQLTRAMKSVVWNDRQGRGLTFRIDEPITFSGRNKIIAIFEISKEYSPYILTLHYGKIPEETLRAFSESHGQYEIRSRSDAPVVQ